MQSKGLTAGPNKIAKQAVIFLTLASMASGFAADNRTIFLVPLEDKSCWQDFVYLAAVPAASKFGNVNPAVLALDQYGTLRRELRDFVARYNPTECYLLDCLIPPSPTTNGLLACWSMEGLDGVAIRDSLGRFPATLQQVPLYDKQAGTNYTFDGRSLKIETGSVPGSGRELTVAFWMKPEQVSNQKIIGKSTNVSRGPGWQVLLRNDNNHPSLRFRVGGGDSAWNQSDVVAQDAYKTNEWVHVTCTFADGVSRIYLNGALAATRENIIWGTPNNTKDPLVLGKSFIGMLDEVRIYHRELNYVEVQQLPQGGGVSTAGLAGYWPLNETEGRIAHDDADNQPLAVVGRPDWEQGQDGGGIRLRGKADGLCAGSGDMVLCPFSVAVTLRSARNQQACILRKPGSADRMPPWSLHVDGTDLAFQVGSSGKHRLILTNALPSGSDAQVMVSCEDKATRIFLNGKLACSGVLKWDHSDDVPAGHPFEGSVKEVSLYGRGTGDDGSRTVDDSGMKDSLIASWKPAGGTMRDAGERKAQRVTGKCGDALQLDGASESMVCETLKPLKADMTVACWIKPETAGCLISALPYEAAGPGWALTLLEKERTLVLLSGHEREVTTVDVGRQPEAFRMGEWVHLAIAFSEAKVTLYLDGRRTMEWKPKGLLYGGQAPFRLGAMNSGINPLRGALDEVRVYDRALTPDEALGLFATKPEISACKRIPVASPEQAARTLAGMFWSKTDTLVCSSDDDYASALVASALAARLKVPLLYWSGNAFSVEAQAVIKTLGASRMIAVGPSAAPSPVGLERILLADSVAALAWMRKQNLPVNYLAAVNPQDRELGRVRKVSLLGPLLAAGREGAVAVLDFKTQWKVPFSASTQNAGKENGTSENDQRQGRIEVNGKAETFLVSAGKNNQNRWIEFKGPDGKLTKPYRTGDRVELCGRPYTLALDPGSGLGHADVWLTWPGVPDIRGRLQSHYQALGGYPEYLCLLGEPDVIPTDLLAKAPDDGEDIPSDQPLANADDDPFLELALGRMVGEDLYSASLAAVRALSYEVLLNGSDASWSGRIGSAGWVSRVESIAEQYGFKIAPHHSGKEGRITDSSPLREVALIVHGAHSWWLEFGGLVEWYSDVLIAPAILESSGCSTMRLDRDELGRSVPERLLRNGALNVTGNLHNGIAQQSLYRSEFWNAVLQGKSVGQAHRYALNRALLGMMDKGQIDSGGDRYQFYNRALFGDPAVRIRIPGTPQERPARAEQDGATVRVYAPQEWMHSRVSPSKEWNSVFEYLHYSAAANIGIEMCWSHKNRCDMPTYYYTVELRSGGAPVDIQRGSPLPDPLAWNGKVWVDEHQDGTRSLFWRVRMLDENIATGQRIHPASPIVFGLKPGNQKK